MSFVCGQDPTDMHTTQPLVLAFIQSALCFFSKPNSKVKDVPPVRQWLEANQWFMVNYNGVAEGPYLLKEIKGKSTFVWRHGHQRWQRKETLVGLR